MHDKASLDRDVLMCSCPRLGMGKSHGVCSSEEDYVHDVDIQLYTQNFQQGQSCTLACTRKRKFSSQTKLQC